MKTKTMINIEYPESLANSLKLNDVDFRAVMKTSALVKLFELGKVSSAVAAKVLGMSRLDFLDLLAKYQVSMLGELNSQDLAEEVENA